MGSNEYVCSLSDKSLKVAKKELNEDPKERLGAVETFREWILQQKHMKCDTDTAFLLRFLRYAKFSQLKARTALEDYLTAFTKHKRWFHNIDTKAPSFQAFTKTGYAFQGGQDDQGRFVFGISLSRMEVDCPDYTKDDVMRLCIALMYLNWYDEDNMVNGFNYFIDASDFTMKQQTYFGMNDIIDSNKIWQRAFPFRYKGFHYYNGGAVLEALMKILKPLMPEKWRQRLNFHTTMERVYKHIPKENLAAEYLPDDYKGEHIGTLDEAAARLHAKLTSEEIRARLLHLTNPENFHIDLKEKVDVPQESFRKLNID